MMGASPQSLEVSTPVECAPAQFYLGLFTVESWREFKRHGGEVMGFTDKKKGMAARLNVGDRLLCYVSKVSVFVAVLRVTGPSYFDTTTIWSDGVFPVRIPVTIETELPLSGAISIRTLAGRLSFLPAGAPGTGWTIHVRSSPRRWSLYDGRLVKQVLEERAAEARLNVTREEPIAEWEPTNRTVVHMKRARLPESVRVGRVVAKTMRLKEAEPDVALGSYETVLSYNKVTGYSVNLPIAETCRPTAMCMKTCYFAMGAPMWSNALRHQRKVFYTMKTDPHGLAERVAMEYDRLGLTFIRWNGGGDLFEENVETINHLARIRPDIIIWVVTRIPEWAARVDHAPNVFVHFSLDKHSLGRRNEVNAARPRSRNLFFSYQCDAEEVPPHENLKHVSVLFFDNYKPTTDLKRYPQDVVCPLNGAADITNTCNRCRRCFDGTAVTHSEMHRGD